MEIPTGGKGDDVTRAGTLLELLETLEVLANTWSVAGCFDITYNAEQMKYVSWSEALAYVWEFRRRGGRLLPTRAGSSVITYITQVEECIRLKAIDYARNGGEKPWAKCLMDASTTKPTYGRSTTTSSSGALRATTAVMRIASRHANAAAAAA